MGRLAVDAAAAAASPVGAMAVETRPELVGKRFLCLAVGEEARPERREGGRSRRGWRAGVIRAVSHRDCRHPDLAVRERRPASRVRARTPTFSQPYLGLPLAPCSAGQLAATPLRRAPGGFAHVPCRGRRLPACGFPAGSRDRVGLPSVRRGPGPAPRPLARRGRPGGLSERRVCAGRWGGRWGTGRTLWLSGSSTSISSRQSEPRRGWRRETYREADEGEGETDRPPFTVSLGLEYVFEAKAAAVVPRFHLFPP